MPTPMRRSWLLLALLACGCEHAKVASNPGPRSRCAVVADHVVDLMVAAMKRPRETFKAGYDSYARHCEHDGWSPELQTCVLEMKDPKIDGTRCDGLMTDAQRGALTESANDGNPVGSSDDLDPFAAQYPDAGARPPR